MNERLLKQFVSLYEKAKSAQRKKEEYEKRIETYKNKLAEISTKLDGIDIQNAINEKKKELLERQDGLEKIRESDVWDFLDDNNK